MSYLSLDILYFNPRTYVRCDNYTVYDILTILAFQSTHLREVRQVVNWNHLIRGDISIHAPT